MTARGAAYGVDGDGDGIAGPYSFRDCIPAMAGCVMANGAPADMQRALYTYNHLWSYVASKFGAQEQELEFSARIVRPILESANRAKLFQRSDQPTSL